MYGVDALIRTLCVIAAGWINFVHHKKNTYSIFHLNHVKWSNKSLIHWLPLQLQGSYIFYKRIMGYFFALFLGTAVIDCKTPTVRNSRRVVVTDGTTYGKAAAVSCNAGYTKNGASLTIQCLNTSKWSMDECPGENTLEWIWLQVLFCPGLKKYILYIYIWDSLCRNQRFLTWYQVIKTWHQSLAYECTTKVQRSCH